MKNIWGAYVGETMRRQDDENWKFPNGYRLKFPLNQTTYAHAVIEHHFDGKGGLVIATILDAKEEIGAK